MGRKPKGLYKKQPYPVPEPTLAFISSKEVLRKPSVPGRTRIQLCKTCCGYKTQYEDGKCVHDRYCNPTPHSLRNCRTKCTEGELHRIEVDAWKAAHSVWEEQKQIHDDREEALLQESQERLESSRQKKQLEDAQDKADAERIAEETHLIGTEEVREFLSTVELNGNHPENLPAVINFAKSLVQQKRSGEKRKVIDMTAALHRGTTSALTKAQSATAVRRAVRDYADLRFNPPELPIDVDDLDDVEEPEPLHKKPASKATPMTTTTTTTTTTSQANRTRVVVNAEQVINDEEEELELIKKQEAELQARRKAIENKKLMDSKRDTVLQEKTRAYLLSLKYEGFSLPYIIEYLQHCQEFGIDEVEDDSILEPVF